jgi:hypothetical protein
LGSSRDLLSVLAVPRGSFYRRSLRARRAFRLVVLGEDEDYDKDDDEDWEARPCS